MSYSEVGRRIGRNTSSISREVKRGTVQQIDTFRKPYSKYFPDVGARVYKDNCFNCGAHSMVIEAWDFVRFAEKKIKEENWSPDAVVGYAKRHELFEYISSTKALYNWIDAGKLNVINLDLSLKLRRSTKQRNSRKHKKVLGMSIEERTESIETRKEFGHWEIDTVLDHKSNDDALLTIIERATRHKIIKRIYNKTAPAVTETLNEILLNCSLF